MSSFKDNDDSDLNNSKDTINNSNDFQYSNILYNNNFIEQSKPLNLGGTRNCFYINDYPLISIGKNISLPLLVILSICCIYFYIFYFFFPVSGLILQKLFNYSFLFYIISHTLSIFLNPGIPSFEYNNKIKEGLKKKKLNELDCTECKRCNLYYKLKDRIGHCDKCDMCYFDIDHHCIWTGHCIARYNNIAFILFIVSIFIFIFTCFAMVLVKLLKIFIK